MQLWDLIIKAMKKGTGLIFLFCCFFTQAQSGFGPAQQIDEFGFQTTKVYASDLDNDGDMDVLVSGQNANTIAWYENLDGNGTFGSVNYVIQSFQHTQFLSTADIDGDGDQDILATANGLGWVSWFVNDGNGNFAIQNIDTNAPDIKQAVAGDIDGDGDIDVVAAIKGESKVVWYENLNGNGGFSSEKVITNSAVGVYQVDVGDIDNNGSLDVICNSSSTGFPSWFKNLDGQGNFSTENMIDFIGTFEVNVADIDQDNDLDLFKMESTNGNHIIHWLENIDGLGTFIQRQEISNFNANRDIFPTDIDNDGDIDLLATFVGDGKIAWFKNLDGQGTFSNRIVIDDTGSSSIYSVDIDGDGYKDALTRTSLNINAQLVWYKNLTYLNTQENPLLQLSITPNPTTGILNLQAPNSTIESITVYDVLGKPVLQQKNNLTTIDLSHLQNGMYLVKIEAKEGSVVKKVVLSR